MTLPRREGRAALAVVALALALRVGYVLSQGAPAPLAGDAAEYRAYASSVASTGRFEGPNGARGTRMPGYPLFLAALETAAGPSTRTVQWAQCLLGALTCLFVFLWAGSLLRPPWALACGLAAACSYDLIAPASWTLTECLYSFLLAASFCFLSLRGFTVRRRALLGGLFFGLTSLVRPEVLPFAALTLAASPLLLKGFARRHAALGLGIFIALGSLWVGRNALVFRRFIPVSTVGGFNLYCGLRLPLDRLGDSGPMAAPTSAGELERDADFRRAYVELRRSVPIARQAKAYLFNLLSVYYPFLPQYDWTYVLLVPFWIFGLWRARARRDLWPVAGLVVGLSVVFAFLAGPVSRYRFGFSPCLILLAGVGAQDLHERTRDSKKFYWAAAGWTAANLFVWLAAGELRQVLLWCKALFWS
jgi:hypothetical protein